MDASNSKPYSSMESLSTELLETICKSVAEMRPLLGYTRLRCIDTRLRREHKTPGALDCKSLRLVCRRFSSLDTPCKALFRDFHLFVTEESLLRLEAISSHTRLRTFLTRISFFAPVFYQELTVHEGYAKQLDRQVESGIFARMWPKRGSMSEWDSNEQSVIMEALKAKCYPYSKSLIARGFEAYCVQYEKQKRLLDDVNYRTRVATCLNLCSQITSAVITQRDPRYHVEFLRSYSTLDDLQHEDPMRRCLIKDDWMSTFHPEILLNSIDKTPSQSFKKRTLQAHERVVDILDVIAHANLQLEELITDEYEGFTSNLEWALQKGDPATSSLTRDVRPLLNLEPLRSLHLNPATHPGEVCDQDWSNCLTPLLERTRNLTELSLYFGEMAPMDEDYDDADDEIEICRRPPSFDSLFCLAFPRLRQFQIERLRFRSSDFVLFLKRHTNLRILSMIDCFAENQRWRVVFDAIKNHINLDDIQLCSIRCSETDEFSTTCISSNDPGGEDEIVEQPPDLREYMFHDGLWTEELKEEWGDY